jgi:uncharacterized protein (TIGR03382 family)
VVSWRTPRDARAAWGAFKTRHGVWTAIWDADTAVPLRMWGPSIKAPGANADDAIAERAARAVLDEELGLLAPGAKSDELMTIANVVHGSSGQFRTVSFARTWGGMEVEGSAVTFLFQNDHLMLIGSTAGRDLAPKMPSVLVDRATAQAKAGAWIESIYGGAPEIGDVGTTMVLPVILERDDGRQVVQAHVVVPVTVDLASPRGRWTVYADAGTGEPIARRQRLMFASGTITYKVGVRWPGGTQQDYPAEYARHTISGSAVTADAAGLITWTGNAAATVATGLRGTYVQVNSASGGAATTNLTLQPGGTANWDATTGTTDAQTTAYIWTNLVKDFARSTLNPNLDWIDNVIQVTVNESGNCNAYSTGDDIHFYVSSQQCENTGRLSDVIRHEFGHSLHGQSIINGAGAFDGALSEGVSDYLSATYVNDPAMGLGFFYNDQALRHLDPATNKVWPDDTTGEVHDDGEIIAQTLWDTRKGLVAAMGAGPGAALADDLYYAIIQRASDIPSSYAEAVAADDDDGDLSNGTPHKCIIDDAFALHGLADGSSVGAASLAPPTLSGLTLSITLDGGTSGACPPPPATGAVATWRLRSNPATTGTVTFTGGATNLTATLPSQADGTVLQYQVAVSFEDGSTQTFPNNAADPWYETYIGPVTQLWCTDLEGDPVADGWVLGGDFEWGAPTGAGGDPESAFSGGNVIGNDLSTDGSYEPNQSNTLTSPAIAIEGQWDSIRLQYRRWLGVEDAEYDHAIIQIDGAEKWRNLQTGGGATQHRDREWRFQDVDITGEAADGSVTLTFKLDSDGGLEFGGWNMDQVCVVAAGAGSCGDGLLSSVEECDDGNTDDGDGCAADCTVEGGGGPDAGPGGGGDDDSGDDSGTPTGGCCSTSGGAGGSLALGLLTLLAVRRRRQ